MRKIFWPFLLLIIFSTTTFSQEPYITTGPAAGLGNYGYLENNAVTYVSLARNTHTNIDFLSARFWVTNNVLPNPTEYLYHTYDGIDGNWNCNDGITIKRTTDFNPTLHFNGEWAAGSDVYVSVFAKYCPLITGPWGPSEPNGVTTGFNPRTFKVMDVISSMHTSTTNMVGDGNGTCTSTKVVGSFVIDPGLATGISLTRLRIQNTGTSLETTDIPNGGFHLYYETVTGTEVFEGSESSAGQLWGNWSGDANNNNYYENSSLAIPVTGAIRVYVLLCDLAFGFTPNRTVSLSIDNDGLSFSPLNNTFFGLMRIDITNITNQAVILPHRFTHFSGNRNQDHNLISASVVNLQPNETITLQKSNNHTNWHTIHTFNTNNQSKLQLSYKDFDLQQHIYYRLLISNTVNGNKEFSSILKLEQGLLKSGIAFFQEATTKSVYVQSFNYKGTIELQLFDMSGRQVGKTQLIQLIQGQTHVISIPLQTSNTLLLLKAVMQDGTHQFLRVIN